MTILGVGARIRVMNVDSFAVANLLLLDTYGPRGLLDPQTQVWSSQAFVAPMLCSAQAAPT